MSLKASLPGARQAIVEAGGTPSRPLYVYLQNIATTVDALSASSGDVTAPSSPISANANVIGGFSIYTQGALKAGIVRVVLQGDTQNPGNTQYYGSGPTGGRGWFNVSDALAASSNVTLTVGANGVTTFDLADLADSGTGSALVKITRDAKGRISGTSSASTTDLAEGSNLYFTDARADARITAQKGLANGLAPLGSDGKLDTAYLPAAVLGQVSYQGTWDASAGTPPTATPEKGWYFIVTVAGSTALDGITDWAVGDWAIYNGTAWDKVDNTDAVVTVNGYTGAVTLTAADVGAATAAQGVKADSAVQPGANVSVLLNDAGYPTDAPSDGQQYARKDGGWVVVAASGSGDVVGPTSATDGNVALFDGTTGKLLKDAGGSFGALVRAVVLTGLSTATSAVIAATDSVLAALGKLQAQITDNLLPKGYIDGLQMQWVSGTALTVSSGAAYIEGSSKVMRASSAIAKTGLSLAASSWYHVYLYDNAGAPDIELVTTAPAAPYSGTARSKAGDTSRRYIGTVLTDSGSAIYRFLHAGDAMHYVVPRAAPFRCVNGGSAVSRASGAVDLTPAMPLTASVAMLQIVNTGSNQLFIDVPESGLTSTVTIDTCTGGQRIFLEMPTASRAMVYFYAVATGSAAYIDVRGYRYGR